MPSVNKYWQWVWLFLKVTVHSCWLVFCKKDNEYKTFFWVRNRLLLKRGFASLFGKKLRKEKVFGYDVEFLAFDDFRGLVEEIFGRKIYRFESDTQSPFIIDCGANIGISVLYFKKIYPRARILAFEPHPDTFKILNRNVQVNQLADVRLIPAAVSCREGWNNLFTAENEQHSVLASLFPGFLPRSKIIKVQSVLLSSYILTDVDLLKIDIEGGEEQVLRELRESGKLNLIKEIHFEYHHHLVPSEDRLSNFLKILEDSGFGYQISTFHANLFPRNALLPMMIYAYRKNFSGKACTYSAEDTLAAATKRRD